MTTILTKCSLLTFSSVVLYTCWHFSAIERFIYSPTGDVWQTKLFLFLPLIASFVLWHFLSLLEKHPEWHEYYTLNSENKELFYYNSTFALYLLKNSVLITVSLKVMNDVRLAQGNDSLFHGYGHIVVASAIMIIIAYYIVHTAKVSQKLSKHFEH